MLTATKVPGRKNRVTTAIVVIEAESRRASLATRYELFAICKDKVGQLGNALIKGDEVVWYY